MFSLFFFIILGFAHAELKAPTDVIWNLTIINGRDSSKSKQMALKNENVSFGIDNSLWKCLAVYNPDEIINQWGVVCSLDKETLVLPGHCVPGTNHESVLLLRSGEKMSTILLGCDDTKKNERKKTKSKSN